MFSAGDSRDNGVLDLRELLFGHLVTDLVRKKRPLLILGHGKKLTLLLSHLGDRNPDPDSHRQHQQNPQHSTHLNSFVPFPPTVPEPWADKPGRPALPTMGSQPMGSRAAGPRFACIITIAMSSPSFRNIALIAHVDHGKTTLVDAMLRATGVFASHEAVVDRVMDSSDQERERGITILAKAASIEWKGARINIVDTPGHADFGGEVERALTLVDGVLLLVDAAEGPMPQTRYVLSKALGRGLPAVVVINKVDRPDSRIEEVLDEIYQLFFDLDADDHHIEFPIISSIAREQRAMTGIGIPDESADLSPLLDTIIETIPAPAGDPEAPVQALVTNLDASDYLGRLAIGRVVQGTLRSGTQVALCHSNNDEPPLKRRLTQLLGFAGLGRTEVDERVAGDLFVVAGFPEVEIGDTLADAADPKALPRIEVDEPVLRMTFGVNASPLSGREGRYLTSRQIRDRLEREVLGNVSIRIETLPSTSRSNRSRI